MIKAASRNFRPAKMSRLNLKLIIAALAALSGATLTAVAQTQTVSDTETFVGENDYGVSPATDGSLTITSTGTVDLVGGSGNGDGLIIIGNGNGNQPGDPTASFVNNGTLILTPSGDSPNSNASLWIGNSTDDGTPATGTVTSSGTIRVDDASDDALSYASIDAGYGAGSTAVLNQTGGLISVGSGALEVGVNSSTATYTMSGSSALVLGNASTVYIGENTNGTGVLHITGNSTVTDSGTYTQWWVGTGTASVGTVEQDGNTTVTFNNPTGILAFGTNVNNSDGPGGTGNYDISSGTLDVQAMLIFDFGSDAGTYGNLNQSGGTVISDVAMNLGDYGTGTYTLSSGTGTFHAGINLGLRAGSNGTLNLNGGELQIGGASGIAVGAGTGAVNFNGGTLQVIDSDFSTSVGINLGVGTLSTVDTNGFNATFNGNFTGLTGGINKIGSGTMTLAGGNNQIGYLGVVGGTVAQGAGSGLTTYELAVGTGTASSGANYVLSGGTITLARGGSSAPSFEIGVFGATGTFTQTGGTVKNQGGSINLGNGTYNISGGTLETDALSTETSLSDLGYEGGSSTVNLSGSGTISFSGAAANLLLSDRHPGTGTPGNGTINQTGGVLAFTNGAALFLTDDGQGTYNLDGGTLEVGGNGLQGTYNGSSGTYQFNLGGGTIQVTGSDLTSDVAMNFVAGTNSTFDTNGLGATFSGLLSGTGVFSKIGAGDLGFIGGGSFGAAGATSSVTGGSVTLNSATAFTSTGQFFVGTEQGAGTLNVTAGTTLNIDPGTAASGEALGYLRIGNGGTGTLNLSGNIEVNVPSDTVAPNGAYGKVSVGTNDGDTYQDGVGGTGVANMSSGTLAINDVNSGGNYGTLDVGRGKNAVGTFNQSGGTVITGGAFQVGVDGGNGTYNLSGGVLRQGDRVGSHIYLGDLAGGLGELNITGTGQLILDPTNYADVGTETGTGIITQNGAATDVEANGDWLAFGSDAIGPAGGGAYVLVSGTLNLNSGYVGFGEGVNGAGIFEQFGGVMTAKTNVIVGDAGSGLFTQFSGSATFEDGAQMILANQAGSTGTVNLDGGVLGVGGTDGIKAGAGQYQFNMSGGTLQVTGSDLTTSINATFTADTTSTVDTNGHNATWSGSFSGSGGFNKIGSGTFTAVGSNPNYSGNVSVQKGAFMVNNGGAAGGQTFAMNNLSVSSGATVGGVGSITAVTLTLNGLVQVGTGANTTDILALNNSGLATLTGADLEFFIGGTDQSTTLAFGTGPISFVGVTVGLSEDLNGTYLLVQNGDSSAADYSGLTYAGTDAHGNKVIKSGISLEGAGPGSYLFVDGNGDIGAVVTPEPGTNAMILSGLVLLITLRYWRSRRQNVR
jgi:hypothetical protein